jgi:hypothetical protein
MVVAMMAMAPRLRLEVVAEGVETVEQLAFLHAEDCPLAQGYLFARPGEPDEIARLLASAAPLAGFVTAVQRAPQALGPVPLTDAGAIERLVRPLLEQMERVTGLESTYLTRVRDDVQEVLVARNHRRHGDR